MANTNGAPDPSTLPAINVLAQYAKDISFENPNAPRSLAPRETSPQIEIRVNVNARKVGEHDFEVELAIEGQAKDGDTQIFRVDLLYGGVFHIVNIPEDQLHPVVMIECPRLLFPFARQIVAESVRNGGFPPLMIDPVDFAALYRARAADEAARQQQGAPN
ncbi:protein-export protein SecB [Methylopila jiangsuensis]|uniref:Protein-export protein SecB n=1 Tax=Methylopila jiangsuensis TaxID=586230 RepID=A0A9W6JK51_9HYPH|nr:protein-export chaperone SecB [Methylopila jiangsuensis]MDR6285264.1 preprotein translocase subunit SecB [Methylopila jiangsuensis]GLK77345.1 protein-export protein SecB [Methylopila jiangsuensis]